MHYYQLHQLLKDSFEEKANEKQISELGITISHYDFESTEAKNFLPGSDELFCNKHGENFETFTENTTVKSDLETSDFDILCNRKFPFHIVQDSSIKQAKGVIVFFHGLNEKKWEKYLPWAYELAKKTHKAVLLFPIAFHMERAPELWSLRKEMFEVAQKRQNENVENSETSYVNAAISSRLEKNPQRIFWSGLQTYSDIIRLNEKIRQGKFPSISSDATLDLFGYSIGSFLSMILMMANPNGILSNSKLFCFCGGMTIDRIFPISKYIMDAKAAIAMQKSFAELLSSNFINDKRLGHYQNSEYHKDESWFKTMLRYNYFQQEREERLKEIQHQIKAFVLKQDKVTPAIEALNTLKGGYRDIDVEVQIEDFPYAYTHMIPFPLTIKNASEVDESFSKFVNSASEFLK